MAAQTCTAKPGSNHIDHKDYCYSVECINVNGETQNERHHVKRSFLHLDHLVSKEVEVLSSIKTQFNGGPVIEYWASQKWVPTVCEISSNDIEAIVDGRIIFRDNKHAETREEIYESLENCVSSCRSQQDYNEGELQRKGGRGGEDHQEEKRKCIWGQQRR